MECGIEQLLEEAVAFFVIRHDGIAAGCGGIKLFGTAYGEIKRMYVRPAFRGLGLGTRMLEHLTAYALHHGVYVLRLETGIDQPEARRLYERYGFRRIPPFGDYEEGPFTCFMKNRSRDRETTHVVPYARHGSFMRTGLHTVLPRWARMPPRQLVQAWVAAFHHADVDALAGLSAEEAINHQVPESPVHGRDAIRRMFAAEFASATMVCIVENIFEEGEWAILEWRDPLGLRGCGFFHVVDGKIVCQ